MTELNHEQIINATINTENTTELSPYIFGHNLEHTRAAMFGGLNAQMLRNRKFAGKPSKNEGCPAGWFSIGGEHAFFTLESSVFSTDESNNGTAYTHHLVPNSQMERMNEIQSLDIQNLTEGECGIGQNELYIKNNETYELRIAALSYCPVDLKVSLTDRDGITVYAETVITVNSQKWTVYPFELTSSAEDSHACLRCTVDGQNRIVIGALSMLPKGHFRGMRRDVIENMKQLGISILRWPGGCFATDYRWQDMFLPIDERAPLQAHAEIETQPYSYGYDNHDIDTDDFIALCREIGAEPFITLNLAWEEPQNSAEWVEYCNGSVDTPYGKKRAERGHSEPYNVRFWSLGNELGYWHAEGPHTPKDYAVSARHHAEAMKSVSPDIELVSSGPYPDDDWSKYSAHELRDIVSYAALHTYSYTKMNYNTPELIKFTYEKINEAPDSIPDLFRRMRKCIDKDIHISFDEWNYWYSWYRTTSVAEGIYAASMLHVIMQESSSVDMPLCCYFQPVNEGAIEVTQKESSLTAVGQVFNLMKSHVGGRLCNVTCENNRSIVATVKDNVLTVSVINKSYDEERTFELNVRGKITERILLTSDSVLPHTHFEKFTLAVTQNRDKSVLVMPPHSVARLTFNLI